MENRYLEVRMDENNRMEEEQAMQIKSLFDTRPSSERVMEYVVKLQKISQKKAEAIATPERRKFQEDCRTQFDKFILASGEVFPGRSGVVDVTLEDTKTTSTVYSAIRGPIVKTENTVPDNDGISMYSDIQSSLGAPNSDVTFSGYCILPDEEGISKYIFACVTRKQYNGIQKGVGVFDIGEVHYSGFYRDVDGVFHSILDQKYMDRDEELGSNKYFSDLEKEFNKQLSLIKADKEYIGELE